MATRKGTKNISRKEAFRALVGALRGIVTASAQVVAAVAVALHATAVLIISVVR